MTVDGTPVPGLLVPVNAGDSAVVSGAADVPGTSFEVEILGTTAFTWSFASLFSFGSATHIQVEIDAAYLAPPVPTLSVPGRVVVALLLVLVASLGVLHPRIAKVIARG